jgi:CoA:oxalate CoA-transferase
VQAGLPASVVRSLGEMLLHPHLVQRGTLQQVKAADGLGGRTVNVVGAGFRFEGSQPVFRGGVPALGEHTEEVMRELS